MTLFGRLVLLFFFLRPLTVSAETLSGEVHWQGQRQIAERVLIEKGATLIIAPGSQLDFTGGSLEVAGALIAEQVRFSGKDWPGLVLNRTGSDTRLRNSRISGAMIGLLIIGGSPQLQGLILEDNEVGIELKQQSRAQVLDCQFRNNNKVGLFVKDGSIAEISGNHFISNGSFGAYIYRANPAKFNGNRFERQETGLMIAFHGSKPIISGNDFIANRIGIYVDRAAKPQLLDNRLRENGVAIKLQRRVDPLVKGNLLQNNELGMLISYSSYPQIVGNDFLENGLELRLEHQSSTWERANGAVSREQQRIGRGAFGTKAQIVAGEQLLRAEQLDGTVDARGNWWGSATGRLEKLVAGGNPDFIHDGQDQPSFQDGGKDYPLDRVRFLPAAQRPQFVERD